MLLNIIKYFCQNQIIVSQEVYQEKYKNYYVKRVKIISSNG